MSSTDVICVNNVTWHVFEHTESWSRVGGDELPINIASVCKDFGWAIDGGQKLMVCPRHYNIIDFHREGPGLRVSICSGLERSGITSDN
jgi:hypothetical protein